MRVRVRRFRGLRIAIEQARETKRIEVSDGKRVRQGWTVRQMPRAVRAARRLRGKGFADPTLTKPRVPRLPRVRFVSSRLFGLQRRRAFGAMRRLGSLLRLKLNPKNFRSSGRATALFASFTLSFSRRVRKRVTFVITRCPAPRLRT